MMTSPITENPITILVVEDEALIRISTATILEDSGFLVLEAGNSAEALEMLSSHPEICIMITDVNMPGQMNGLNLVARVCCDYGEILSIIVSGHSCAEEATKAGAAGFLAKPYMAHTMVQTVTDTLKHHPPAPQAA